MIVEFTIVEYSQGPVNAGTLELKNGELQPFPEAGYEQLFKNILEDFKKGEDPKEFLASMPERYKGNMMRARLVE